MHAVSPDHAVVTFAGPDALAFLQSQLTNDVAKIAVGGWQWQGYCSAKGRLYATFALARTGDTAFAAIVHGSVLPALVKRLTMFRLRSKLDISADAALVATLHLAPSDAAAPGRSATLDLGHGRWISIDRRADGSGATDPAFIERWNLLGIEARQPEVTAATAELFVPQMIGWDVVQPGGGVDFGKGCYPGQEVVARAHYRGAVKRHLERAVVAAAPADLREGGEITLADGRIGEICNMVRRNDGETHLLLVVQSIPV